MYDGFRTTNLPEAEADPTELIGNVPVQGIGPLATRRVPIRRLQSASLSSTGLIGARFIAAEARLSTLEGLAGIPGGANLSAQVDALSTRVGSAEAAVATLTIDNTASRVTRYWPRPGEAIRTWTAFYTSPAKDAPPLEVASVYSTPTNGPGGGPSLTITGTGYASPIAKTHLDDDEVVEFTFKQARRTDNTGTNAAANNIPINAVACFRANGSYLGEASFPVTILMKSDLMRTVTYRVSLLPAFSQVVLPAGTRFVAPIVGERGTGAMDFYAVDRRNVPLRPLTTAENALTLRLMMVDALGNESLLSPADTKSFIQGLTMDPVTYPYYPTLKADLVSRVVLPADPDRFSVGFQADTVDLAVNINFQKATFDGSTNSKIIYAGNYEQFKRDVTGPISVAARVPPGATASTPAPINFATVGRLTATGTPSTKLTGDDRMSYWPDQNVDIRLRNALRIALNNLDDSPLNPTLGKLTLIGFMCGVSRANNAINLANPSGPAFSYRDGASGAITTVPYGYTQGNGSDQYIDSGLLPGALGMTADGHFMAAKVDGNTIAGATYIMGNSGNYFLNPNRSETLAAFKTGTGVDTAPAAPGSWIALNRTSLTAYDQYVGDAKVATVTRSLGALPTSTMTLLSAAGGGPTAVPLRIAIAGYGLQAPATVTKIIQEFSAVLAVCDQIRFGG